MKLFLNIQFELQILLDSTILELHSRDQLKCWDQPKDVCNINYFLFNENHLLTFLLNGLQMRCS